MRDFDNSKSVLEDASTGGVGHFCFFIQNHATLNPSFFYWYASLSDLFSALENDLYALLFNEEDEEIVSIFNDEIQQIISEFKLKRTPVYFELTKRINEIFEQYEDSSVFSFSYIGTYDSLCAGSNEFERTTRGKFREKISERNHQKSGFIKDDEMESFNDFLCSEQD